MFWNLLLKYGGHWWIVLKALICHSTYKTQNIWVYVDICWLLAIKFCFRMLRLVFLTFTRWNASIRWLAALSVCCWIFVFWHACIEENLYHVCFSGGVAAQRSSQGQQGFISQSFLMSCSGFSAFPCGELMKVSQLVVNYWY